MKKGIFIFLMLVLGSKSVLSQVSQPLNARLNVKSIMSINITKNKNLDLKFNTSDQLEQGILLDNAINVKIKSNQNWNLMISSLTPNFLAVGPDTQQLLSSSIIGVKKSNQNNFIQLTQNPGTVASGERGGINSIQNQFNIDLKATPGLQFDGGNFTMVMIFTLSPQ
jgi:hypothetical protein